jgi:aspartyl-tRNA(Asn)/glutamyl-tRNA(Gln) amidotransferase subunit C
VSSVPPTSARQPSDDQPSSGSGTSLTKDDVAHLAQLARLELTDQELDLYVGQLSVILDAVATVTAVAAGDIEPTTHAVPLTNVYREDVVRPCLTPEAALAGAPAAEDGRFRVPQILGEEQ